MWKQTVGVNKTSPRYEWPITPLGEDTIREDCGGDAAYLAEGRYKLLVGKVHQVRSEDKRTSPRARAPAPTKQHCRFCMHIYVCPTHACSISFTHMVGLKSCCCRRWRGVCPLPVGLVRPGPSESNATMGHVFAQLHRALYPPSPLLGAPDPTQEV